MKRWLLLVPASIVAVVWWVASAHASAHFWHYYFFPQHAPWWMGAVWGNVIAIAPSAPVLLVIGMVAYFWHKRALDPLRKELAEHRHAVAAIAELHADHHTAHMDAIAALGASLIDVLDPDTEGPTKDILDRLDPETPGGIAALRDDIAALRPWPTGAHGDAPRT